MDPKTWADLAGALHTWSGATEEQRERVTDVLDVVLEGAGPETARFLVVARDILDAATDGLLRPAGADEEALIAATDLAPDKVVSLILLVIDVLPESEAPEASQALEKLAALWTREERRAVADWATALHVLASDDPEAQIPARPGVLDYVLVPGGALGMTAKALRHALVERLMQAAFAALRALASNVEDDASKVIVNVAINTLAARYSIQAPKEAPHAGA